MTTQRKTQYHPATANGVRRTLEVLRGTDTLVRIVYGDRTTGLVWMEENDVVGYIGRSTGTQPVPLLVAPQEIGGPQLLDHCILGIQTVPEGTWLYKAKNIKWPELCVTATSQPGYRAEVIEDPHATPVARFKTWGEAHAWAAFMQGAIPCLPQHFVKEAEDD